MSIVAAPLALQVLSRVFGQPLEIPPAAVARLALISVLVPLAAGILLRALAPAVAARLVPVVGLAAKVLLPVAAVALLATAWQSVWAAVGNGGILAIVAFIVIGFAVGHLLGGPEREHSVVLGLSSACRHPAIAFTLASANFPGQHVGGAIILYLLVTVVLGIPYVKWNRQRIAS
jgi:BASS family bile acid:Na+ symporter